MQQVLNCFVFDFHRLGNVNSAYMTVLHDCVYDFIDIFFDGFLSVVHLLDLIYRDQVTRDQPVKY